MSETEAEAASREHAKLIEAAKRRREFVRFLKDVNNLPEAHYFKILNFPLQSRCINVVATKDFTYRGQSFAINDRVRIDMETLDFVIESSTKTKRRGQVLAQLEVADYADYNDDYSKLNAAYHGWSDSNSITARKELAKQIGIVLIRRYVFWKSHCKFLDAKTVQITSLTSENFSQIDFKYKIDDQPEVTAAFYVRFNFEVSTEGDVR